jgi:hypothetical protein
VIKILWLYGHNNTTLSVCLQVLRRLAQKQLNLVHLGMTKVSLVRFDEQMSVRIFHVNAEPIPIYKINSFRGLILSLAIWGRQRPVSPRKPF